jgi:hypothetical protein
MAINGVLLRADDGSLHYVPPDVVDRCRLDGDQLAAVEGALAEDGEAIDSANGSTLRLLGIGPRVGRLLGLPVAEEVPAAGGPGPDEPEDDTADGDEAEDDGVDPLERFRPRRRQPLAAHAGDPTDGDGRRGAG